MLQRRKQELVHFRPWHQDERRQQNCLEEWASKLAESDKGSYYNQEKWLKEDKAFGKPTETTMESVAGEKLQENSRKPYVVDFAREVSNF